MKSEEGRGKAEIMYQEQLEVAVIALYADRRLSTKSLLHVSHVCIGPLPFLLSIAWKNGEFVTSSQMLFKSDQVA